VVVVQPDFMKIQLVVVQGRAN